MAVHVTMRLHREVRNARKFGVYRAIARATLTAMITRRMRIVHFSVQRTHLHAIVEVDSMMDLARGMQGFQIAAARRINRALGRAGCVFADRYHAHYLEKPTEARNAIRYVLNNWRHHREDQVPKMAGFRVDPFSSAPVFGGFSDFNTSGFIDLRRFPPTYERLAVFFPRTWLLRRGWLERGGGSFSVRDTPR